VAVFPDATYAKVAYLITVRRNEMGGKVPKIIWFEMDTSRAYVQNIDGECARYIHESLVPISCGGTLGPPNANPPATSGSAERDEVDRQKELYSEINPPNGVARR
jgi:hypothetical protein